MRKFFYVLILLILLVGFGVGIWVYKKSLNEDSQKSGYVYDSFSKINGILTNSKTLPQPGGAVIYYSFTGKVLATNQNYDVASGWLCGKGFTELGIDFKDPFTGKCFKYSITKDSKYYQIAAVIKDNDGFKSILTGNIDKTITKNYLNDGLIQDKANNAFPYNPETRFLTARIIDLKLGNGGKLVLLDYEGKKHDILNDYSGYVLRPYDTLLLKGKDSVAYIKFENQDVLKIEGGTIIKIKETEVGQDNQQAGFFWLVGKIVYNIYDTKKISYVGTPGDTIAIRGSILEGFSKVDSQNYVIQTKQLTGDDEVTKQEKTYNVKKHVNPDQIINNNNLGADVLGYRLNIEDMIELEK